MFIQYHFFFKEFGINPNSNRFNISLTTVKGDLQYMVDEKIIKKIHSRKYKNIFSQWTLSAYFWTLNCFVYFNFTINNSGTWSRNLFFYARNF